MNEQQLAAVKQAVESMTDADRLLEDEGYGRAYQQESITALQSIISQDALHKMAEESRTSGLRLDDWDKIGCVNHDCDKCKAVQEPVSMRMPKVGDRVVCIEDESLGTVVYLTAGESPEIKFDDGSHGTYMLREFAELFGYTTPPAAQPVPVKTYHDGKPWPVAPKPWVGLTDEEIDTEATEHEQAHGFIQGAQWAEAKLKEKNHDQ
jgi:hypothetical protein